MQVLRILSAITLALALGAASASAAAEPLLTATTTLDSGTSGSPTLPGGNAACGAKRVRKPWGSYTTAEQETYLEAAALAIKNGIVNDLSAMHIESMGEAQAHHSCAFFTWHRRMLLAYESYLRNLGPKYACVTLPYYDAHTAYVQAANKKCSNMYDCSDIFRAMGGESTTTQVSMTLNGQYATGYKVQGALFANNCDDKKKTCGYMLRNNLKKQPVPSGAGFSTFQNIVTRSKDYATFLEGIQFGLHNEIHNAVGGAMATMASPRDVLFFSWHGAIDMFLHVYHLCHIGVPLTKADLQSSLRAFTQASQTCGGVSGIGAKSKVVQNVRVNGKLMDVTQHPTLGKYFAHVGDEMWNYGDPQQLGDYSYTYELPEILMQQLLSNKDMCAGFAKATATPAPTTQKPTEKPTLKPTEKPTLKPVEKPTLKPTEKPVTVAPSKSSGSSSGSGSGSAVGGTVEVPTTKPTTEKPTAKPATTASSKSSSSSDSGSSSTVGNTVKVPTTEKPTPSDPVDGSDNDDGEPTVKPSNGGYGQVGYGDVGYSFGNFNGSDDSSADSDDVKTGSARPSSGSGSDAGAQVTIGYDAYGKSIIDSVKPHSGIIVTGPAATASGSSDSADIVVGASNGTTTARANATTVATTGDYWVWVKTTYDGLVERFNGDMELVAQQMQLIECQAFDNVFGFTEFSDDFVKNFHLASSRPLCGKKVDEIAAGNVTVAVVATEFKAETIEFADESVIQAVVDEYKPLSTSAQPLIDPTFVKKVEADLAAGASSAPATATANSNPTQSEPTTATTVPTVNGNPAVSADSDVVVTPAPTRVRKPKTKTCDY